MLSMRIVSGKKSHVDFLAIDHIAGRKADNSEPESVELGYSFKVGDSRILDYQKFFQEAKYYVIIECSKRDLMGNVHKNNLSSKRQKRQRA